MMGIIAKQSFRRSKEKQTATRAAKNKTPMNWRPKASKVFNKGIND